MTSIRPLPILRITFIAGFILALLFALYTNRVWEDYYITFRSSKNLASGNGLVYNVGDRLHTFTSPLGVLIPAVCSFVTGNSSDTAALWLFRVICAAAFGGAITLLISLMRKLAWPAIASGLLAIMLLTDAKSLDFTINGMETAFMLLFLAYAFWSHLSPGPRQWLHLGAAWAGLMWTRPDSFIYIGLIAAGCWLFNQQTRTGGDRRQQLLLFLKAGLLTTALYGPWLIWAGWYYGTPIPHTIVAKAAMTGQGEAMDGFFQGIWQLPYLIWKGSTAAEGSFLPAYYMFPTWPSWNLPFGRILATIASLLWLVPRLRLESRMASFSYFVAISYLSFVPYFPFPWYLPATTLLAWIAISGAGGQLWQSSRPFLRWIMGIASLAAIVGGLLLTVTAARHAKAQQTYVEDGNRRLIGEWLHDHAAPGDSVFMEPLGYIGYFSELKTYDWPGMSSREVPEATKIVGALWQNLILYLQPNWLVLRANGEGDLTHFSPILAGLSYDRVKEFDRRSDIEKLDIAGKNLLLFDSHFAVYHRRAPLRHDTADLEIASPIGSSIRTIHGKDLRLVHAPGYLISKVPPEAKSVQLTYGFPDDAIEGDISTNGAIFFIWLYDGETRIKLREHRLEPNLYPQHRGLQKITLELPPLVDPHNSKLILETDAMGDTAKDWTFWSDPVFQ